jgi:ankyrin repeat protein
MAKAARRAAGGGTRGRLQASKALADKLGASSAPLAGAAERAAAAPASAPAAITLAALWERRGGSDAGMLSSLRALDLERTGFVLTGEVGRALELSREAEEALLLRPELSEWLTPDRRLVNYEGLVLAAASRFVLSRFRLLAHLFLGSPVLHSLDGAGVPDASVADEHTAQFLERFDKDQDGRLTRDEVTTAFELACVSAGAGRDELLDELVAQATDQAVAQGAAPGAPTWSVAALRGAARRPCDAVLANFSARCLRRAVALVERQGMTPQRVFELLDRDGDGVLGKADLHGSLAALGFPDECLAAGVAAAVWELVAQADDEGKGAGLSQRQLAAFSCSFSAAAAAAAAATTATDATTTGQEEHEEPGVRAHRDGGPGGPGGPGQSSAEVNRLRAANAAAHMQLAAETALARALGRRAHVLHRECETLRSEVGRLRQVAAHNEQLAAPPDDVEYDNNGDSGSVDNQDEPEPEVLFFDNGNNRGRDAASPPLDHYRRIYGGYSHEALVSRACVMRRDLARTRKERLKALRAADLVRANNGELVQRTELLLQQVSALGDALAVGRQYGHVRVPSPHGGDGPDAALSSPRDARAGGADGKVTSSDRGFWRTLLELGDGSASAVLRDVCAKGDLFSARSLVMAARQSCSAAHALQLLAAPDPGTGDTALHCAARAGAVDLVRTLAAFAAQHNVRLEELTNVAGETPVATAAQAGRISSVRALQPALVDRDLARGAGANVSPLMRAAAHAAASPEPGAPAWAELARELDADKAHVNERSENGCTALAFALLSQPAAPRAPRNAAAEAARLLVAAGADPAVPDARGWTPLDYCAAWGLHDHLQAVLEALDERRVAGGEPGQPAQPALLPRVLARALTVAAFSARVFGSRSVAALLWQLRRAVPGYIATALAAYSRDVVYVTSPGAIVNPLGPGGEEQEHSVFFAACECGLVKLMGKLARIGARVGLDLVVASSPLRGATALMVAATNGRPEIVAGLLAAAETTARRGGAHGGSSVAALAAYVNARDNEGRSALSLAASRGHAVVCEQLLGRPGTRVSKPDRARAALALARATATASKESRTRVLELLDGFLSAAHADGIKHRLEPGWMDVAGERDEDALGRPAPQGAAWVIADEHVSVANPAGEALPGEALPGAAAADSIGAALDALSEPGSSLGSPPGSPASANKAAARMDELDEAEDNAASGPSGEPAASQLPGRIVRILADGHDAFLRGQAPNLLMVVVELLVPPPAEGGARGAAPTVVTVTLPASALNGGRGVAWLDAAVERTEAGAAAVLVADGQRVTLAHSSLAQLRHALLPLNTAVLASLGGLLAPPAPSAKAGDKPTGKPSKKARAVVVAAELEAGCWPRYVLETAAGARVPGVTQDRIVKVVAHKAARKKGKRGANNTSRKAPSELYI